jgi:hypothetical protein
MASLGSPVANEGQGLTGLDEGKYLVQGTEKSDVGEERPQGGVQLVDVILERCWYMRRGRECEMILAGCAEGKEFTGTVRWGGQ